MSNNQPSPTPTRNTMQRALSGLHTFTKSKWVRRGALALVSAAAAFMLTVAGTYYYVRSELPPVNVPGVPADPLAGIPPHVVKAFLAAEDQRFFEHGGVDSIAVGRAILNNSTGGLRQGGSTITQQTAKRLLVHGERERTLARKVKETVLAAELERQLAKDEILRIYLDGLYLGAGTWGIAQAAEVYFGKPVQELTLAQAALLAGLPARPRDYNPLAHPDAAERRRSYVLDRMAHNGWISATEHALAELEPLVRAAKP